MLPVPCVNVMKKTSLIIVVPGLKGIDNVGTFDQDVFSGVVAFTIELFVASSLGFNAVN